MPENRKYDDPFPKTLEDVRDDLDYWAGMLTKGVAQPGSVWHENVRARVEHLRDLERRFEGQQLQEGSDTVFVSCGQFTKEERKLGRDVCDLVRQLTPFTPYFADMQSSLEGLTDNILGQLNRCVGLIAVMHPRGEVVFPNGAKHTRGSVWIEQELGIAAFITQVLKRPIKVAAYIHYSVKREGMRDQLHLNPVLFETSDEVQKNLRDLLPSWRGLSAVQNVPLELIIGNSELKITQQRHDYELAATIKNTGSSKIEEYQADVLFPAVFLDGGTTFALEVHDRRTETHRFFRATQKEHRKPLYAGDSLVVMTIPYFVDNSIYRYQRSEFRQNVKATLYTEKWSPVVVEKSMQELQNF